ncbi:MAG TPA: alkaline phosphatase family protein [Nitrososphaerales archaeon]|nr:alkaline phosphatase family protein [Nitrososphaerales archaeon]
MLPPGAVKPDYARYCLSNLPSTLASVLGYNDSGPKLPEDAFGDLDTSGIENVIVMLCDGFGYNEWQRQVDHGFFGALAARGSVRPITPVFPSTTSANLTSLATGLTPQEHGLPEWYVYMQEVGEIVITLPFVKVGDSGRDTLVGTMNPRSLFDGSTIYQRMKKAGIRSTSFTSRALAHTAYSNMSRAGSRVSGYSTASDLSVSLRTFVERARGTNYIYVYWSYVDTIEHIYGPGTDEALVEGSLISHALQEGFLAKLDRNAAKKTMVVVTADHGQLQVDSSKTLYTNRFSKMAKNFQKNSEGKSIRPWGSARDTFMLLEEEKLDETTAYLQKKLKGVASVIKTDDAISAGLFGVNKPTKKFRRRVGNLMVLPHGNKTVWYRYVEENKLNVGGHHGGLTEPEMTIPLAAARVSDLQ